MIYETKNCSSVLTGKFNAKFNIYSSKSIFEWVFKCLTTKTLCKKKIIEIAKYERQQQQHLDLCIWMCTTKGDIMAKSTKDKTILTNEKQNKKKTKTHTNY